MRHKLIIIDGHSTVGKSTVSKSVFTQICQHDNAYWLHEECFMHPIRHEEFTAGSLQTAHGMELNRHAMLSKWRRFGHDIRTRDHVCITEGCFLHTLDRHLVNSIWDEPGIVQYYHDIMEIIAPVHPLIIFLHRPDIRTSFEKAFLARGEQWRNLILCAPEPYGYFQDHAYVGDESVFQSIAFEQAFIGKIFEALSCEKLKIDTSDEAWEEYVHEITTRAGYTYTKERQEAPDTTQYCGTYRLQEQENLWEIGFHHESNCYYSSLFWPYMPMKYTGNQTFELISFPVELKFERVNETLQFHVRGNYGWGYTGKTFVKIAG